MASPPPENQDVYPSDPHSLVSQVRNRIGTLFYMVVTNSHRNDVFEELLTVLDSFIDHLRSQFGPDENPDGSNVDASYMNSESETDSEVDEAPSVPSLAPPPKPKTETEEGDEEAPLR